MHTLSFLYKISLFFFFSVWFLNPGNKVVALGFLLLPIAYYLHTKNLRLSIFLAYVSSLMVYTGKTYLFELIPTGIFPIDRWPEGFLATAIISPKHVLSFIMGTMLLIDLINSGLKHIKPILGDYLFISFYLWIIISDLFASRRSDISLIFTLLSVHIPITYFYLRAYLGSWRNSARCVFAVATAIVTFESIVSLQQLVANSTLGKSIEFPFIDIQSFAEGVDELVNRFRPLGTLTHANELGALMSFSLPLIVSALLIVKNRMLFFSLISLIITTLIATLSRSAWLATSISTLVLFFALEQNLKQIISYIPRVLKILSVIAAGIFLIYFIYPRLEKTTNVFFETGGAYFRIQQADEVITLISLYPFWGVGTQMSVVESVALSPPRGIFLSYPAPIHNWYLLQVIEHGIPALLIYLLFVAYFLLHILKRMSRLKPTQNRLRVVTFGTITSILSLYIIGLFQPFLSEALIVIALTMLGQRFIVYYNSGIE